MDAFEKLTLLQNEIGYVKGNINAIALLGLFGEAGEILNEALLVSEDPIPELVKQNGVTAAEVCEWQKKQIRDGHMKSVISVVIADNEQNFDIEMADALYYLNALAINRGKTLADYAELSYKKVSAKTKISVEGK